MILTNKFLNSSFKKWIEFFDVCDTINDLSCLEIQHLKYQWFVDIVLVITTYSKEISVEIGTDIIDICKYILVRSCKNNKYDLNSKIKYKKEWNKDPNLTKEYVIYLNLMIDYLNWGINIYHAWFDSSKGFIIDDKEFMLIYSNLETLFLWLDE